MACVDFPSGYFQVKLQENSQGYTAFNREFGKYPFLRAPKGHSSLGDAFNSSKDKFNSRQGGWILKQVDDMYIQAVSMKTLFDKLEVATKEAIEHDCTLRLSKFFTSW